MRAMTLSRWIATALALPLMIVAAPVSAQAPAGAAAGARPARPAGQPLPVHTPPTKDPAAAPAATYRVDPNHASVIAVVLHEGTSFSTFRMNKVAGALNWNPRVEASTVEVTVESKSVDTPAPGFIDTLLADQWLNAEKFPEIKFVSTAVHRTGPTTGEITGNLTFLGKTKPIVVRAELVGIGASVRGVPTIGFKGAAKFKRSDFGLTTLAEAVGDDVELLLDIEFRKAA
jgi:polyisoprenoid-binding protein YceI